MTFRSLIRITLCLFLGAGINSDLFGQDIQNNRPATIPDSFQWEIESSNTDRIYQIQVGLPRGYETTDISYDVVYLLDANALFGMTTDISRNLTVFGRRRDAGLIIVGVGYPVGHFLDAVGLRSADMTPTRDSLFDASHFKYVKRLGIEEGFQNSGGANEFLAFLKSELVPEIENRFRVNKSNRTIIGWSAGGLFALFAMLEEPDLFDKYLVISPALWWGCAEDTSVCRVDVDSPDGWLQKREQEMYEQGFQIDGRMYMTVGAEEYPLMIDHPRRLDRQLQTHNYPNFEWKIKVEPEERHVSILGSAITHGLRWLYFDYDDGPGLVGE